MSARSSTVGPAPLDSTPTTPVPPMPGLDRAAILLQLPGDALGGALFLVGQLGMLVQILVESLLVGLEAVVAGQDLLEPAHGRRPPLLEVEFPQVGPGEFDELVAVAGQDGPGRVQREALDLLVGELGRQREFVPGGGDVDQRRRRRE